MNQMDCTNYSRMFTQFQKSYIRQADSKPSVYTIDGINIFNVCGLMKDAENAFRVTYLP